MHEMRKLPPDMQYTADNQIITPTFMSNAL